MRFPLRRVVLGFAAGAAAGWAVGLLRSPADAPAGSSADAATRLPQEEFGDLGEVDDPEQAAEIAQEPTAPPRKATAPAITPIPGSDAEPEGDGGSEPATAPEAGAEEIAPAAQAEAVEELVRDAAKPAKPRRRRTPAADPTIDAAEALREGRTAATERLTAAETPPAVRRRRPPPTEG
jgi:hypothetical protein